MKHAVATYRTAGLEAKWTKRDGKPFIAVRHPAAALKHQRETWWLVTRQMHEAMTASGIIEGFTNCTLLGDVFSI